MHEITARKSKVITDSAFKGYDYCINPYVGCQMGCSFCYVRFFIKDPDHAWGEFVRIRKHIDEKLPKEIEKLENVRLVFGTMTDPYMPLEKKHRITRTALTHILNNVEHFDKIGIFTRSPVVLDDIDLISKLPRARVHVSISPFENDIIKKLEPITIPLKTRFNMVKKLKEAGIRVHVNIAPCLPVYSDKVIEYLAKEIGKLNVDEFFIDPVQPYGDSLTAITEALTDDPDWEFVSPLLQKGAKKPYSEWKESFRLKWQKAWEEHGSKNTLAIWSDHENRVWRKLISNESMDPRMYGDDLEP